MIMALSNINFLAIVRHVTLSQRSALFYSQKKTHLFDIFLREMFPLKIFQTVDVSESQIQSFS